MRDFSAVLERHAGCVTHAAMELISYLLVSVVSVVSVAGCEAEGSDSGEVDTTSNETRVASYLADATESGGRVTPKGYVCFDWNGFWTCSPTGARGT